MCNELQVSSQIQSIEFPCHKSHQHSWQQPCTMGRAVNNPAAKLWVNNTSLKGCRSTTKHCVKEGVSAQQTNKMGHLMSYM